MSIYCEDPFGVGCEWSGEQDDLVEAEGTDDCAFTHCPECSGTIFDDPEADEEPEDGDEFDEGGES